MSETNPLTRAYRIVRILLHTFTGIIIAALILPLINQQQKLALTRWWCKKLLNCFNIQVRTYGDLPPAETRGVMFVGNHISWADIHALNSVIPLRFVAKSDIKNWPVFGYLVRASNTIFIDRTSRKDATRIVGITAKSLAAGDNVCFFPEGTTTDGTHMMKFKSSIVQAAIEAESQIWPVAIRYPLPNGGINTKMAYAGDTSMGESMSNVLMQKNPIVELHFLAPIPALGANRQALTEAAFTAISKQLSL